MAIIFEDEDEQQFVSYHCQRCQTKFRSDTPVSACPRCRNPRLLSEGGRPGRQMTTRRVTEGKSWDSPSGVEIPEPPNDNLPIDLGL
jgi:DNA-directed RNA polymerase subunit RPC12/RpoP